MKSYKETYLSFEVVTYCQAKPLCPHFLPYFQEVEQLYQLNIFRKNIQIIRQLKPVSDVM